MQVSGEYDPKQARDHLLEQYKLLLRSIDNTTNDRHAQSRFVLAIATAILGAVFVTTLTVVDMQNAEVQRAAWIGCSGSSAFGAYTMWVLSRYIRQCEQVIGIRYEVLKQMEVDLPAKPYTEEGELRKKSTPQRKQWVVAGKETELNNSRISARFASVCTALFLMLAVGFAALASWPEAAMFLFEPTLSPDQVTEIALIS